jgi:signal transduction protein with GAF and PtsI domain
MLPLVNDVDEVKRARALLEDEEDGLRRERIPVQLRDTSWGS